MGTDSGSPGAAGAPCTSSSTASRGMEISRTELDVLGWQTVNSPLGVPSHLLAHRDGAVFRVQVRPEGGGQLALPDAADQLQVEQGQYAPPLRRLQVGPSCPPASGFSSPAAGAWARHSPRPGCGEAASPSPPGPGRCGAWCGRPGWWSCSDQGVCSSARLCGGRSAAAPGTGSESAGWSAG